MLEIVRPLTTTHSLAVFFGATLASSQLQYPPRIEPYELQQVRGTYSPFIDSMNIRAHASEHFAQQVAAIYSSLAERQHRLDVEFESAIFDDLDSLYEV